jgi:uridine kinase
MTESNPRVIIIAGPNGAGKATFAHEFYRKNPHRQPILLAQGVNP